MPDEGGVLFTADMADRIADAVAHLDGIPRNRVGQRRRGNPSGVAATVTVRVISSTAAASIASGVQTVTPASMSGIVVGSALLIDAATSGVQETVTVTAITATTFTATFANAHTAGVGGVVVGGSADANGWYPGVVTVLTVSTDTWADLGAVVLQDLNGALLTAGIRYRTLPAGVSPTDGVTPAYLTTAEGDVGVIGCRLFLANSQEIDPATAANACEWYSPTYNGPNYGPVPFPYLPAMQYDTGGFFGQGVTTPTADGPQSPILTAPVNGYYRVQAFIYNTGGINSVGELLRACVAFKGKSFPYGYGEFGRLTPIIPLNYAEPGSATVGFGYWIWMGHGNVSGDIPGLFGTAEIYLNAGDQLVVQVWPNSSTPAWGLPMWSWVTVSLLAPAGATGPQGSAGPPGTSLTVGTSTISGGSAGQLVTDAGGTVGESSLSSLLDGLGGITRSF